MYHLSFNIVQLDFARVPKVVNNLRNLKLSSLIHLGQIWSTLGTLKDHLKGSHGIYFPWMEKNFHIWKKNSMHAHCSLLKSRGLFWWKWLLGQSVAALNFKSYWRAMEQSGADKNGMGGIPTSLGARNTIPNCRQMRLDMTIPNSLI